MIAGLAQRPASRLAKCREATTVRREWLRGFLARKTAPRNALVHVAITLGRAGHDLRKAMESGHPTACELLGMQPVGSVYVGRPNPIAVAAQTAPPQRATMLALAVLLGAAEDATSRQTWRNPTPDNRAYFTALQEWGYPLSDVEQLVLPPTDTDTDTPAVATDGRTQDASHGDESEAYDVATTGTGFVDAGGIEVGEVGEGAVDEGDDDGAPHRADPAPAGDVSAA